MFFNGAIRLHTIAKISAIARITRTIITVSTAITQTEKKRGLFTRKGV